MSYLESLPETVSSKKRFLAQWDFFIERFRYGGMGYCPKIEEKSLPPHWVTDNSFDPTQKYGYWQDIPSNFTWTLFADRRGHRIILDSPYGIISAGENDILHILRKSINQEGANITRLVDRFRLKDAPLPFRKGDQTLLKSRYFIQDDGQKFYYPPKVLTTILSGNYINEPFIHSQEIKFGNIPD